jgi:hypothetical protein
VKPPFSLEVPLERTEKTLRGLGHQTTTVEIDPPVLAPDKHPSTNGRFGHTSDTAFKDSIPKLSFLDASQDWEGEHRELMEEHITFTYEIVWDGDRMNVKLEADPADRNYVIYIVIEEKLQGGKGNVLHTAMPVPMNGQLTYVPQSFFDAEQAIIDKARKAAAEFNRKYSLSTEVAPGDPVVGWLRPGDLSTTAGLTKFMTLAKQHEPGILKEVMAADPKVPDEADCQ